MTKNTPRNQRTNMLRSSTPPAVNTVSVSEFVRGGIYAIDTPTVVMSHSTELGTWYPRGQGVATYYAGSTNTMSSTSSGGLVLPTGAVSGTPAEIDTVRDAIAQLHEFLNAPPKEKNG